MTGGTVKPMTTDELADALTALGEQLKATDPTWFAAAELAIARYQAGVCPACGGAGCAICTEGGS